MRITIKSKVITKTEIINCINLLGEEYTNLDIEIEIHTRSSLKSEKRMEKPDLTENDNNSILAKGSIKFGIYISDLRKIKLFPFNIRESDYNKINHGDLFYRDFVKYGVIFSLYHEIRHAWQHTFDQEAFLKEREIDPSSEPEAYYSSNIELDADDFEHVTTSKFCREIREILQINSNLFPTFHTFREKSHAG